MNGPEQSETEGARRRGDPQGRGGEQGGDPFFIIYKARSGSTHLADLLTIHPDIGIAPESNLVLSLWEWSRGGGRVVADAGHLEEALDLLYSEPKFAAWEVPREALRERLAASLPARAGDVVREAVGEYCRRKYPHSRVRGVKKGSYALHVPKLRALFPSARFILLVRDGRAVYASSKRAEHSETRQPFETDAARSARVWKRVVTALDAYRDARFFLEVRYEQLISEPERTLRSVLDFLGVAAEPSLVEAMLRPHEPSFVHRKYSYLHPHVGKAAQVSRIDGWRDELPPDEIREFERVAGRTLASKGYAPVFKPSAWEQLRATLSETRAAVGRRLRTRK